MHINLKDKNVLLGVTGSISAYKACDIARLLVKSGASVHIVMTPSAERFVSALTFEALTRNPVLTEETECWSSELNHIDIGKKCDVMVIAPATANTVNKLSKGIADNILLQTALAYSKTLIVAPAANTQMLANHYTEGSIKMLRVNDIIVVDPQSKLLACGDTGAGALADPEDIFYETAKAMMIDPFWEDRRVVVTGGGTREKIDDVRYLTNYSSGKMAKAVATALYLRGADVCYITTKGAEDLPRDIYVIEVEDTQEMLDYTKDAIRVAKKGKMSRASMSRADPRHLIQKVPYLFMVAAVTDYTPKFPQTGKLKKSALGEDWNLELKETPDILSTLDKFDIKTVAFKAEMDEKHALEHAKALLEKKRVDAVCLNVLKSSDSFGTDENEILFVTKEEVKELGRADKFILAEKILDEAKHLESE
jgi:phosphopantothenoylcysteine decarboxylase/phosphopantothenate--cysteine ligase